jgi:hypothetical protein
VHKTIRHFLIASVAVLALLLSGCNDGNEFTRTYTAGETFLVPAGQKVVKSGDSASIQHIFLAEDDAHYVRVLSGDVYLTVK